MFIKWNKATNLISTIKVLLIICQIFGLYADRLDFHNENTTNPSVVPTQKSTKFKKFITIYTFTFLIFLITIFFIITKYNILRDLNIIVQVADVGVVYSNLMLFIIDVIGNYLSKNLIQNTILELIKTEDMFKHELNTRISFIQLKKFLFIQMCLATIIWMIFGFYYILVLCTLERTRCFMVLYAYYMSTYVSHLHVLQFCSFIITITIFFKAINQKLIDIYNTNSLTHQTKVTTKQWMITSSNLPSASMENHLKTFNTLRQIYDRLCDNTRKLNRAFSLQLLFTFGNSFVVIFCSVYGCLFGYVVNGYITDRTDIKYFFLPACILSVAILKLFLMTLSCETLVAESKLTGAIIHKISLSTQQRQIKDTVQEFSLQLIHQSFNITAFGFFNVDCTLLQTIVGAVTTYLIILIQFDLTMTHGDNLLNAQSTS